jgi:hypothetical protein
MSNARNVRLGQDVDPHLPRNTNNKPLLLIPIFAAVGYAMFSKKYKLVGAGVGALIGIGVYNRANSPSWMVDVPLSPVIPRS